MDTALRNATIKKWRSPGANVKVRKDQIQAIDALFNSPKQRHFKSVTRFGEAKWNRTHQNEFWAVDGNDVRFMRWIAKEYQD